MRPAGDTPPVDSRHRSKGSPPPTATRCLDNRGHSTSSKRKVKQNTQVRAVCVPLLRHYCKANIPSSGPAVNSPGIHIAVQILTCVSPQVLQYLIRFFCSGRCHCFFGKHTCTALGAGRLNLYESDSSTSTLVPSPLRGLRHSAKLYISRRYIGRRLC